MSFLAKLTLDTPFKKAIRNNKAAFEHLLSSFLHEAVVVEEYCDTEVPNVSNRSVRIDAVVRLGNGKKVFIELQKAASRAQMIDRMTGNVSIHYADQWRKQH